MYHQMKNNNCKICPNKICFLIHYLMIRGMGRIKRMGRGNRVNRPHLFKKGVKSLFSLP